MKIVTVVGARPQFVKAAVLSRQLEKEYLVHTGQHYDTNMSEVFFQEMEIPKPDINLEIGSGSHGKMTGLMLAGIEKVLQEQKPDALLTYGDTNSTLAAALAASKLNIPVAHVEAGLRSFYRAMPEEQNRIVADHLSTWLFCPTDTAVENLKTEGITQGVHQVGDVMLDASLFYRDKMAADDSRTPVVDRFNLPEDFYLLTLHRAENTDDPARLSAIVEALNSRPDIPGVLPLHPRTKKYLAQYGLVLGSHIKVIDPVGYFDMLELENRCRFIVTDSGGVQKEAYFFSKPCITLRDQTEWVETVKAGANTLCGADTEKIQKALDDVTTGIGLPQEWPDLYGGGKAGRRIIDILTKESPCNS